MEEKTESEFGKGFTYCLGLFLAHEMRKYEYMEHEKNSTTAYKGYAALFMNGAGDHFFEFEAEKAPESLRPRCEYLRMKVLEWRLGNPNWDDVEWALQQAKDILREYDNLNGFDPIKGKWE